MYRIHIINKKIFLQKMNLWCMKNLNKSIFFILNNSVDIFKRNTAEIPIK